MVGAHGALFEPMPFDMLVSPLDDAALTTRWVDPALPSAAAAVCAYARSISPRATCSQSGFTSYRIGKDHMTVHFHAHNGTELYVTQPILPRDPSKSPGPLPPLPPPAPPAPKPPAPPPSPPAPTPAGMKWECHAGMESAGLAGLQDADHTQGFKTVADCEGTCNGIKGCSVVNWHGNDLHCHTLTGTTTHAKFTASLRTAKSSTACMLIKSNPE
jgi:hypothetical protein